MACVEILFKTNWFNKLNCYTLKFLKNGSVEILFTFFEHDIVNYNSCFNFFELVVVFS